MGRGRSKSRSPQRDRTRRHDRRGCDGRGSRNAEGQSPGKSGQQKAREAIEREREKARLKRLERERAQQERAQAKEQQKERRREETQQSLDAGATEADVRAAPVADPPQVPLGRPRKAKGSVVEEALARKLFQMLDRSGRDSVSPRDVLIALKRHPQVRRLFSLPTNSVEEGGTLESRLVAIQDAFEAGSGLGEVSGVFAELREGSGEAQAFRWEAFWASCCRGALTFTAAAAVALLPREHATGVTFVPTSRWTEVPEGAACPGGLEYKMDVSTGRTLARLPLAKL